MKVAAGDSKARVEDVYREAVLLLLDRRERKPVAEFGPTRASLQGRRRENGGQPENSYPNSYGC